MVMFSSSSTEFLLCGLVRTTAVLLLIFINASALICYDQPESTSQEAKLTNCTKCHFCGVIGTAVGEMPIQAQIAVPDSFFVEEEAAMYKKIFEPVGLDVGGGKYAVTGFCLIERMTFNSADEFIYRCFCNSDRCNIGGTITSFTNRLSQRAGLESELQRLLEFKSHAESHTGV